MKLKEAAEAAVAKRAESAAKQAEIKYRMKALEFDGVLRRKRRVGGHGIRNGKTKVATGA